MLKEIWKVMLILLVVVLVMLGTATKLQTARNIKLQGAVSGKANFDGSENVIINTTQTNITVLKGQLVEGEANINYPSGYTKDNCVIISFSMENTNLKNSHWAYGGLFDSSSYVGAAVPYKIYMNVSNISIRIKNIVLLDNEPVHEGEVSPPFNYRLILMKI